MNERGETMNVSRFLAVFTAIVTLLFNLFPNWDYISDLYLNVLASDYDWVSLTYTLSDAIKDKNSEQIVSLASPKLKEKYSDLDSRIEYLIGSIEGDVISVQDSYEKYSIETRDYDLIVKTTTDYYRVFILFTCVAKESEQDNVGIRRIMISTMTDNYGSCWIDPDYYNAAEEISDCKFFARRWYNIKGNNADEYNFAIERGNTLPVDDSNVTVCVRKNNSEGTSESDIALQKGESVKIHFIPENEAQPEPGTRTPEVVTTYGSDIISFYLKPGRYYLYVEPSNQEMYFSVSVSTEL